MITVLSTTFCYRRNNNLGLFQKPHIELPNVDIVEPTEAGWVFVF